MFKNSSGFLLAVLAASFNVLLALLFSRNGYEAFITTALALGIWFTLLSINNARLVIKSRLGPLAKLLATPVLGILWFVVIGGVILSISNDTGLPLNQWLVVIGTPPYLLPKLGTLGAYYSFRQAIVYGVAIMYSIIVLLVAAIDFHSAKAQGHTIILVLAVQLQYVMNYAVLKTNYLEKSLAYATTKVNRRRLTGSSASLGIVATIVGLPFFVPLAVVFALI